MSDRYAVYLNIDDTQPVPLSVACARRDGQNGSADFAAAWREADAVGDNQPRRLSAIEMFSP